MTDQGIWQRTGPLSPTTTGWSAERWSRGKEVLDIDVLRGKPFDVVGLKGIDLQEVRDYARFLGDTASSLYDGSETPVTVCVVCGSDVAGEDASTEMEVFGIGYGRCSACGHTFVRNRPTEARLDAVFADSEAHSAAYTDPEAVEARMTDIIAPKINWVREVWRRAGNDRDILSAVDIGAGGGHFVEGLRRAGVTAEGFELSTASRRFAMEAFGLALRADDVLTAELGPVDVVTMWGLLEYTQDPGKFVRAGVDMLAPGGMLVIEVPRFDSVSSAVQLADGAVVARHLDPTSHVNCFSDASLATLLVESGVTPRAAWYFGMDVYELLMQAALRLDDSRVVEGLADWIPWLQALADQGSMCDDLVIAATMPA